MDINLWKINKKIDQELSKYQNRIVTRFPPEPSGYLHIVHAKAILINYVIAKRYEGQMILRIDNTNPNKETQEYDDAIIEDIKRLGIVPDRITKSSDYFDKLIEIADQLITNGQAFVEESDPETMSKERLLKIDSAYRNVLPEENMIKWAMMKNGKKDKCVLRIKMSMQNKNVSMRDPVIFKINRDAEHYVTGYKYKVYPTYDFACPVIDSLEGVTHMYRSTEFNALDVQYKEILKILNMNVPKIDSYGKLNFQDVDLSKRKIKALIESGDLGGWDDPRLLTIRGALRRGLSSCPAIPRYFTRDTKSRLGRRLDGSAYLHGEHGRRYTHYSSSNDGK